MPMKKTEGFLGLEVSASEPAGSPESGPWAAQHAPKPKVFRKSQSCGIEKNIFRNSKNFHR